MSHVHGDRVDHSRGGARTRWWGVGILSLARLTALRDVTDVSREGAKGGLAMGNWAAFAIGVSGLLLLKMFLLQF